MVHCTLEPGGVSKAVAHRTIEEAWHFISGWGQVWRSLDGAESVVDVFAGVSLTIETGSHFQFRNTGDEKPMLHHSHRAAVARFRRGVSGT